MGGLVGPLRQGVARGVPSVTSSGRRNLTDVNSDSPSTEEGQRATKMLDYFSRIVRQRFDIVSGLLLGHVVASSLN
eukprot:scaffold3224_cov158-Amphora_coffeaeformis.AAC.5